MGDQRLPEVRERRFARADLALRHKDPDLAILHLAERVVADLIGVEPPLRRRAELGLGDEVADRRIGAWEPDASRLAHETPASVAADEIPRPQGRAFAQGDVDARGILGETCHLDAAQDRNAKLRCPALQDALGVLLGERQAVRVTARESTDVEAHAGEPVDLCRLAGLEEPLDDAALVEHLQGPSMQAEGAGADALGIPLPFDDDDLDARERQLGPEHQPGRAAADDDHCMLGHSHLRPNRAVNPNDPGGARAVRAGTASIRTPSDRARERARSPGAASRCTGRRSGTAGRWHRRRRRACCSGCGSARRGPR